MRTRRRLEVWAAALHVGLATLPREPILGLKRAILPVSYWRAAEFAYALDRLALPPGSFLLDLGSPKDLAAILARERRYRIVATDILDQAVELSRRYATAQGLDGDGAGRVQSVRQDGRGLDYPDHTFDAAFSISVLEHIPHAGDSAAVRELMRVVKPGGLVVGTVPYDRRYRETFVEGAVYERQAIAGEKLFFERHYDGPSLRDRLLEASGAELIDLEIWGERAVRTERLLTRAGRIRDLFAPFEALLSICFLDRLETEESGHPMAAFFTLRKTRQWVRG